jgi:hypothetical protein
LTIASGGEGKSSAALWTKTVATQPSSCSGVFGQKTRRLGNGGAGTSRTKTQSFTEEGNRFCPSVARRAAGRSLDESEIAGSFAGQGMALNAF